VVRIGKRRLSARKFALIISDLILVVASLAGALYLNDPGNFIPTPTAALNAVLLFLVVGFFSFITFGFYAHIWRFASIAQYMQLLLGIVVQTSICWGLMLVAQSALPFPVYIIYMMLFAFGAAGTRIAYRAGMNNSMVRDLLYRRWPQFNHNSLPGSAPKRRRLMIIGAGVSGYQLIREMLQRPELYEPVAVIDDNPLTHTYRVLGVPVVGGREDIPAAVKQYRVDDIILAIPSAPRQTVRAFVDICHTTGCELKMVPLLQDLFDGKVSISAIKNVDIDDLLGRDEVVLDTNAISGYLEGETVLVTGGGGSIGSELCRQIARFKPRRLIVFDIYENNAYQLQYELKAAYGNKMDLVILIGSVRDEKRLLSVFQEYKPGVVFHAAAHKHVPLMQDSPGEAVKNNIIGTRNTARAAARADVKRFVLISTDKAVRPTNVMGATKRFAELVIQSIAADYPNTRFAAVRFGNVLGSNGSVIPLFKQQIANERRVTVTHPDITRYFMTIPEAARLVIQAGALANNAEIFVLDMGQPVRIDDLARDLIRLSGFEPGIDVEIAYTGLRPGEKMYEELFHDKENMTKSSPSMISKLKPIRDCDALNSEIASLLRVIRWDSDEFERVRAWIEEHIVTEEFSENAKTKTVKTSGVIKIAAPASSKTAAVSVSKASSQKLKETIVTTASATSAAANTSPSASNTGFAINTAPTLTSPNQSSSISG